MTYTIVIQWWMVVVYSVFQIVATAITMRHTHWLKQARKYR